MLEISLPVPWVGWLVSQALSWNFMPQFGQARENFDLNKDEQVELAQSPLPDTTVLEP